VIAQAVVAAATRRSLPRRPFLIDGCVVGSVAERDLPALARFTECLQVDAQQVVLQVPRPERDAALAHMHQWLHAQGLIKAWRDETYALVDPQTLQPLALIERAASRFWGTLTFGAHATGYVADAHGRPTQLWIAQRSAQKATDPGMLDNLVGGGVPHHQTPWQALLREAWEEAGLAPELAAQAQSAGVLAEHRDIPEGLQHEWLYSFDLALPPGHVPQNQDGEVAAFTLMAPAQVMQHLTTDAMTVDAALVTAHFLHRHQMLPKSQNCFDPVLRNTGDAG
jgi:8-oxo-dGTP pyrophosphatase MutT (NUDIX family)